MSDDQMTVTFSSSSGISNQWLSVVAETYFTSGVHSFELKINHCASNWLFVGVAGKNWKGWLDNSNGMYFIPLSLFLTLTHTYPQVIWVMALTAGHTVVPQGGVRRPICSIRPMALPTKAATSLR